MAKFYQLGVGNHQHRKDPDPKQHQGGYVENKLEKMGNQVYGCGKETFSVLPSSP